MMKLLAPVYFMKKITKSEKLKLHFFIGTNDNMVNT